MNLDDSNFYPQFAAMLADQPKNEAVRPDPPLVADPPVGPPERGELMLGAAAACGWTARGLAPASVS